LERIVGSKSDGAACEPAPTIAREDPPGHMGGSIALQSELAAAEQKLRTCLPDRPGSSWAALSPFGLAGEDMRAPRRASSGAGTSRSGGLAPRPHQPNALPHQTT
jgi:hypothetical protein